MRIKIDNILERIKHNFFLESQQGIKWYIGLLYLNSLAI